MKPASYFPHIVGLSILAILSTSCNQSSSEGLSQNIPKKHEETKSHNPNDLWLQQRSFNESFNPKAYISSLEKVKEFNSRGKYLKASADDLDEDWTSEGPGNIGGRFNTLANSPTDPNTIYAGAANGGIFKTTDGGTTWNPIFDDQAYLAISVIAVDPNDANIVYTGTGDRNFGGSSHLGNGIYKSLDAGNTWSQSGLIDESIVADIIINPDNSQHIYAATLGNVFDTNQDRGVYKSLDGGATWDNVLFVSDSSGAIDLIMDHTNPEILYVSFQNRVRTETISLVSGPDVGIYKTVNGGTDWVELSSGLPTTEQSRIGLAISPTDHNKIFACYTDTSLDILDVYKSINGGTTWTPMNAHTNGLPEDAQGGFGWYFGEIYQNPYNENQLIIPGVEMFTTIDNGLTWEANVPPWYTYEVHADKHAILFLDSLSYIIATDGGLYKTIDNGATWEDIENIPVTQFYHIAIDPTEPEMYGGGAQDNGSMQGNGSLYNEWLRLYGGDGFRITFLEESDGDYFETQRGGLRYVDYVISENIDLKPSLVSPDRVNWDMPYYVNESEEILIAGTSKIHLMEAAPFGFYEVISEDLTQVGQGPYDGSIARRTITEITQPKNDLNTIFAGTSDGFVWRGENDGTQWNWTNISGSLPNRYVTALRVAPDDNETIYVGFSGYKFNEQASYLYKSTDNGDSWTDISGNLPNIVVNDVLSMNNIGEDSLFAALDGGVYFTEDGGSTWDIVGDNLPLVTISELAVDYQNKKLVAGTYSRSMYTYDIAWLINETSEPPVSIHENDKAFEVYPNPVENVLHFNKGLLTKVDIYNIHGQLVESLSISSEQSSIDMSKLSIGTYFIKSEGYYAKFIKK